LFASGRAFLLVFQNRFFATKLFHYFSRIDKSVTNLLIPELIFDLLFLPTYKPGPAAASQKIVANSFVLIAVAMDA
jgi:hypothetical protein